MDIGILDRAYAKKQAETVASDVKKNISESVKEYIEKNGITAAVSVDNDSIVKNEEGVLSVKEDYLSNFKTEVLDKEYPNAKNILYTFNTMPSDNELLKLPNNTVFSTKGYYSSDDGAGSSYIITDTWLTCCKKIILTDADGNIVKTRYLRDTTEFYNGKINLLHYGLKRFLSNESNVSDEEKIKYGEINNKVCKSIANSFNKTPIIYIPVGIYYFNEPIKAQDFTDYQSIMIVGDGANPTMHYGQKGITSLVFPFLNEGDIAVKIGNGGMKNISIVGEQYSINFDRSVCITDPDSVITETYEVKATGVSISGGTIENVSVRGFYTGINMDAANSYNTMLKFTQCHYGLICGNDNKFIGMYGRGVHTLFKPLNSLVSATQIRVDSCVHVIEVDNMNGLQITDLEGDWCTNSIIHINGVLKNSSLKSIIGRHSCLVCYDSATESYKKASDITIEDYLKYGVITLKKSARIENCYIECNATAGNPFDTSTTYRYSPIIISTGKWCSIKNTKIYVNQDIFEPTKEYAKDICFIGQTNDNIDFTLESGRGRITYFKKEDPTGSGIKIIYFCEDYINDNSLIDFSTEWEV